MIPTVTNIKNKMNEMAEAIPNKVKFLALSSPNKLLISGEPVLLPVSVFP